MATQGSWPSYGTSSKYSSSYSDIETGGLDEGALRWGFIRKVYGILASQILLTLAVASFVVSHEGVKHYLLVNPGIVLLAAILPFVLLCAVSAFHQSHPWNLILLSLFSLCFSLTLGLSCAFLPAKIVVEALLLTALVVLSLTAFTFYAAKQGWEFDSLGPALFTALIILVGVTVLQAFFNFGSVGQGLVAGAGAIIFSLYIIFDTHNLIRRYSYDEYIWASLALYLDIINLFSFLLDILSSLQGGQQ